MRRACKNIMYTMVNSYTYENYDPNEVEGWVMTLYIVDGILALVLIVGEVLLILNYRKKTKTAAAAPTPSEGSDAAQK